MDRDAALREAMVARLERTGVLRGRGVAAAMRAVPRHRFLPSVSLDDAYADRAIALKTDRAEVVSSISQPGMVALMLDLLAPARGDRVLEIGTGSGYNAALLAELAGPDGSVTTVDLDGELTVAAHRVLRETGYAGVRVLTGDGVAESVGARFDRVIVTARGDDVAAPWWDALESGGRIVVPLRLEGAGEYAVGFVRQADGSLRSCGLHPCAFIALRGEAAAPRAGDVFYRDSFGRGSSPACLRRVAAVSAVRREEATPAVLGNADVVVARPVSVFAITFA